MTLLRVIHMLVTVLAASAGGGSWQLVWADEFDGDTLNASLWTAALGGETPPNWNQIELYSPANVAVANGSLVLTTRVEDVTYNGFTYNITSGRVDSSFKGNITPPARVEVRARLQNGWAYGVHTAAWLLGYACWPTGGEVDIFEFEVEPSSSPSCGPNGTYPNAPSCWIRRTSNYHYGHACNVEDAHIGGANWPNAPVGSNPINFTAEYHVFAVEMNDTAVVLLEDDGSGVFQQVNAYYVGMPRWPNITVPTWDQYIILSQAFMANRRAEPPSWVWPVTQEVDYVRVYAWQP